MCLTLWEFYTPRVRIKRTICGAKSIFLTLLLKAINKLGAVSIKVGGAGSSCAPLALFARHFASILRRQQADDGTVSSVDIYRLTEITAAPLVCHPSPLKKINSILD